jgi:hypothetical protein
MARLPRCRSAHAREGHVFSAERRWHDTSPLLSATPTARIAPSTTQTCSLGCAPQLAPKSACGQCSSTVNWSWEPGSTEGSSEQQKRVSGTPLGRSEQRCAAELRAHLAVQWILPCVSRSPPFAASCGTEAASASSSSMRLLSASERSRDASSNGLRTTSTVQRKPCVWMPSIADRSTECATCKHTTQEGERARRAAMHARETLTFDSGQEHRVRSLGAKRRREATERMQAAATEWLTLRK